MRNHHHLTCKTVPPPPTHTHCLQLFFLFSNVGGGNVRMVAAGLTKFPSEGKEERHNLSLQNMVNQKKVRRMFTLHYYSTVLNIQILFCKKSKRWYGICIVNYAIYSFQVLWDCKNRMIWALRPQWVPYQLKNTLYFIHFPLSTFDTIYLCSSQINNLPDVGFYLSQGSIAAAKIDEKFLTLVGFLYNRKSGNQTSAACHTSLSISSVRSHTSTPVGVWRS